MWFGRAHITDRANETGWLLRVNSPVLLAVSIDCSFGDLGCLRSTAVVRHQCRNSSGGWAFETILKLNFFVWKLLGLPLYRTVNESFPLRHLI
jgi:hypothetical protein